MITTPASAITKAASNQTYYTIRFLVDRGHVEDAYRSYAYFRWVDDVLDANSALSAATRQAVRPARASTRPPQTTAGRGDGGSPVEAQQRIAFLERQRSLLESCYQGETPRDVNLQEKMLVELVQRNREKDSGLGAYLRNMLLLMDFDARRRGRLISQAELNEYTRWLAIAVTENLHHFIGHGQFAPHDETRYLAVSAAHITHMLRDTYDDLQAGYYNIPREVLEANHIGPEDIHSPAYRAWVKGRVSLAREYFEAGRRYFARVQNPRCRLACFAYIARFDWLLDTFEREGYLLRPQYDERKHLGIGLRTIWLALSYTLNWRGSGEIYRPVASQRMGKP